VPHHTKDNPPPAKKPLAFEGESLNDEQVAAREEHRRLKDKGWDRDAEARSERRRQEDVARQWFSRRPLERRSRFSMAEIADEVAPLVRHAAGHRDPGAIPKNRREVIERLAVDMGTGYFNDRCKIIVALGGALRVQTGRDFKTASRVAGAEAWFASTLKPGEEVPCTDPKVGEEEEPYRYFLRATYITREACAAWLREHEYPWPRNFGDEPALPQAAGPSPESAAPVGPAPATQAEASEKHRGAAAAGPGTESGRRKSRTLAPEKTADQKLRCGQVHAAAKSWCDKHQLMPGYAPLAKELARGENRLGFSEGTIRQILNGSYRSSPEIGRFTWQPPKGRQKG
jgi:hypothetical protein